MERKRVLVVDDERDVVESIRFNLEREEIETIEAYNGEDALAKAKKEHPQLIIIDVMLPLMNGYKVTRLLKRDDACKDIPVIILTAKTGERDIRAGLDSGADKYMAKPFDMAELVSLVKQHLPA